MIAREIIARDIAKAVLCGLMYQCEIDGYHIRVESGIAIAKKSKAPREASFIVATRDDATGELVLGKYASEFEWIIKALMPDQHRETIDDRWGEL